MTAPTKDAEPPEPVYAQERKDHTTRRLVKSFQEQLTQVEDEMSALSNRLEALRDGVVTHKGMMAWAGAFAVTVIVAVWVLLSDAKHSIKSDNAEHRDSVREEIGRLREDNLETRRDVKALYQSVPKRRRQDRLEQPLAEDIP